MSASLSCRRAGATSTATIPLLTFLQSLSLDAHFAIDQLARSGAGHFFNFNGTAGIWRKAAILDAGGWRADTLTEDLDLSYRAFLRGWTARFAGDVEAAAELPVSFTAFRRQQHRWARGSMECAIRFLPQIWRGDARCCASSRPPCISRPMSRTSSPWASFCRFPFCSRLSRYYPALLDPVGIGLFANLMFFVPDAVLHRRAAPARAALVAASAADPRS